METRLKRGDTREDGMVFWGYAKSVKNGEWWVSPEKFAEKRENEAARKRDRYANDPEYREKQLAYIRDRRANDPEFREATARYKSGYSNKYQCRRRASDPLYAAKLRLRCRTRDAFRRLAANKPASTQELLGTDWQNLKAHIESRFIDGMSWENMSEWHIDHIVPLASAKIEEELVGHCHYTNLQPLWASDNLSKGAKLPEQLGLVR